MQIMKTGIRLIAATLAALVLPTVQPAHAQGRMSLTELIDALKPGQWVEVQGIIQRDSTVLCSEIKLLTGDFLDDDWELSGVVDRIDKTNEVLYILNVPIKVAEDAEFESEGDRVKGFGDLKQRMYLEIEGTYLKDRTFLAREIEDESEDLAEEPDLAREFEAVGKVDSVDPARRTIQVMGITFRLTDRTKSKSAIK